MSGSCRFFRNAGNRRFVASVNDGVGTGRKRQWCLTAACRRDVFLSGNSPDIWKPAYSHSRGDFPEGGNRLLRYESGGVCGGRCGARPAIQAHTRLDESKMGILCSAFGWQDGKRHRFRSAKSRAMLYACRKGGGLFGSGDGLSDCGVFFCRGKSAWRPFFSV